MTPDAAKTFLREASRYFENRPTGGEDAAFWSNAANSTNCKEIADMIENKVLSGCAVRAVIQQEQAAKITEEERHYLGAIKVRLNALYDLTEAPK